MRNQKRGERRCIFGKSDAARRVVFNSVCLQDMNECDELNCVVATHDD